MAVRPLHLLLGEDNSAHARLATMAIRGASLPATVDRVIDGEEALAYLTRQPPHEARADVDLILLDLKAPRMDGIELLQRIRATQELQSVPVIILSSSVSESQSSSLNSSGP